MQEDVPSGQALPNALVSADEWSLECGRLECGARLADVAWIDINFNMAANNSVIGHGSLAFDELPSPQFRRYRLGVMFGPAWQVEEDLWSCRDALTESERPPVPWSARVVRGSWNGAELGQQGLPPFTIECPECRTVQSVSAHRRKGTPRPGKAVVVPALAEPVEANEASNASWPSGENLKKLKLRYG
jgi:hypothetical protein